jgi:hypothetical protein
LVWTEVYEEPSVDLYWYDQSTGTYNVEQQPSPAVQYYHWSEPSQSFVEYSPEQVQWSYYYEESTVDLGTIDQQTGEFV